jgi:hypothetical protein
MVVSGVLQSWLCTNPNQSQVIGNGVPSSEPEGQIVPRCCIYRQAYQSSPSLKIFVPFLSLRHKTLRFTFHIQSRIYNGALAGRTDPSRSRCAAPRRAEIGCARTRCVSPTILYTSTTPSLTSSFPSNQTSKLIHPQNTVPARTRNKPAKPIPALAAPTNPSAPPHPKVPTPIFPI